MDMGYAITGKKHGEPWKSDIFEDVQEMVDTYDMLVKLEREFTDLKQCRAYTHYEVIDMDGE